MFGGAAEGPEEDAFFDALVAAGDDGGGEGDESGEDGEGGHEADGEGDLVEDFGEAFDDEV